MIGRRQFITLLGGAAAAWPILARAQQSAAPVKPLDEPLPVHLDAPSWISRGGLVSVIVM